MADLIFFSTASNRENPKSQALILYMIYLVSGCCGLIYQTVWIRKFSLVFGSTILSMSIVIAVFFGGLALGSRWFGKKSDSTDRPIFLYAVLEIITALYALAFPYILAKTEILYAAVYPLIYQDFTFIVLVRILLSCLVLLLPTILMGGTLPLLVRHFITRIDIVGNRTGLIYGLNTLGAACGSLISGYFLLHAVGTDKTNLITGLLNLGLGLAALFIGFQEKAGHENSEKYAIPGKNNKQAENQDMSGVIVLTVTCFGISGFVSMAYEVIWLRYTVLFFRDTAYLYSGIITVFITGIALGSFLCGVLINRIRKPVAFFGFLQVGIGFSMLPALYFPLIYHQTFYDAGEKNPLNILGILFCLLFVPTLFMGATFPAVARIITINIQTAGDRIGRTYSINILGSILGSLFAGFVFFLFMGIQEVIYLLFGLNMLMAVILLAREKTFVKYMCVIPLGLSLLFPACSLYYQRFNLPGKIIKDINKGHEIVKIRESLTGTSWIVRDRQYGVVSLLENRVVISRADSSGFVMQGLIPQLLTPEIPKKILGLCFGGGLSYYGPRMFPGIKEFDMVDISRQNIELALEYIPQNRGLESDPRFRFIIDDAFNFVKYTDYKYDLIIMDPTPPVFAYRCASLYTREFYKYTKNRLIPGGFFSQVVPLRHMADDETVNVMKTFSSVFDHCLLWWNGFEPVMIGSNQPFAFNVLEIDRRIKQPEINKILKTYSKGSDYARMSHFISGLLLNSKDFKEISARGTIYTSDLNQLELSSWDRINVKNIERIHKHLSPWDENLSLFFGIEGLNKYSDRLAKRREYLMNLLYRMYE